MRLIPISVASRRTSASPVVLWDSMTGRRLRAHRSAAVSLLLLACVAGLLCASSAQAAFELTAPRLLTDPSPAVSQPDYAPRSEGGGLAAWWQEFDSGETSIQVASISEGGRPGEAVEIDHDPQGYLLWPSIATAQEGYAAVAWGAGDPLASQAAIRTTTIGSDGEPGSLHEVDSASDTSLGTPSPTVLVDSSGRPVVVWLAYGVTDSDITRTELRWARVGADGGLLGEVNVIPFDTPLYLSGLRVGIDSADRVTAVWEHDGNIGTIRFGLDGERSPMQQFTSGPGRVLDLHLVVASDGSATVVWRSWSGSDNSRVRAVQLASSDTEPGPLLELSAPVGRNFNPVAAAGPGGRITILWERWRRDTVQVVSRQIKPGGALGPLRPLSAAASHGRNPAIVSTAAGRLFAAWQRQAGAGARRKIQLSRLDRAGRVARSAAGGPGIEPELAISGGGRPVVTWRSPGADRSQAPVSRPMSRPIALSTIR